MRQDEIFPPNLQYYFRKAKREEEEHRQEKDRTRREKLAAYYFDISKLSFAGIFATVVIPLITEKQTPRMWVAVIFGLILTALSAMLANKILK